MATAAVEVSLGVQPNLERGNTPHAGNSGLRPGSPTPGSFSIAGSVAVFCTPSPAVTKPSLQAWAAGVRNTEGLRIVSKSCSRIPRSSVYIPLPNRLHKTWVMAAADAGKTSLREAFTA